MNQRIFVQGRDRRIRNNCDVVVVDICPLVEFLLDLGGFVDWSVPEMVKESAVANKGRGMKTALTPHPRDEGRSYSREVAWVQN
jgi:hypothetical protein